MADTKTSDLPSATALAGTEQIPGVQSAASVKVTAAQIKTFCNTGVQPLDAELTALAALDPSAGLVEQTGAAAFTKRTIGVASSTDVPTRGDGDTRWQASAANLTSWAALAPSSKQDTLVSATNIKTVNGASILGSGDLVVTGSFDPAAPGPIGGTTPSTVAAISINKVAITAPATSATLTIADGKTLTVSRTITFAGTDGVTVTLPTTSATMARTDAAQSFAGVQTFLSQIVVPDSASDPGIRFSGTNVGLRHNNASDAGSIAVYISSADRIGLRAGHGVTLRSLDCVKWNSTDAITLTYDAGYGRYAAGVTETNNGTKGSVRGLSGGGAAVASATALPLPTGRVFHVTGTTNITSITSTNFQHGVVITLIFDGILTLTHGNNIKLRAGNVTTAADLTVNLAYDGTYWHQC